jgi:hypothetical protein
MLFLPADNHHLMFYSIFRHIPSERFDFKRGCSFLADKDKAIIRLEAVLEMITTVLALADSQ